MKPIKFVSFLQACVIAGVLFTIAGCAGLSKSGKITGYVGTTAALREHPEWRPHFVTADNDLAALEASETIDVVNVLAIMNRLPVEKLDSKDAVIVITGTTILISEFGGDTISLNEQQTAELRKFVKRLREGIKLALAQTQAPPPGN